jgi:hypothetical protein
LRSRNRWFRRLPQAGNYDTKFVGKVSARLYSTPVRESAKVRLDAASCFYLILFGFLGRSENTLSRPREVAAVTEAPPVQVPSSCFASESFNSLDWTSMVILLGNGNGTSGRSSPLQPVHNLLRSLSVISTVMASRIWRS